MDRIKETEVQTNSTMRVICGGMRNDSSSGYSDDSSPGYSDESSSGYSDEFFTRLQ